MIFAILSEAKFTWHDVVAIISGSAVAAGVYDSLKPILSWFVKKPPYAVRIHYRTADGKTREIELHTQDAERMTQELSDVEVDAPVGQVVGH